MFSCGFPIVFGAYIVFHGVSVGLGPGRDCWYLRQELLCNQIYIRPDSDWKVIDSGVMQISSELQLVGGGGRAQGPLAVRSMAWTYSDRPKSIYIIGPQNPRWKRQIKAPKSPKEIEFGKEGHVSVCKESETIRSSERSCC